MRLEHGILEVGETETRFILDSLSGTHVITSPLIGRFNVMNLLASLAVIHAESQYDSLRKVGSFEELMAEWSLF